MKKRIDIIADIGLPKVLRLCALLVTGIEPPFQRGIWLILPFGQTYLVTLDIRLGPIQAVIELTRDERDKAL